MRLFLLILCVLVDLVTSQTISDVKNLMTNLFTTQSYNKKIRPIAAQTDPIPLDVSLIVFSINAVDEVQQKLVTTGYLQLAWKDESLVWNPASYNNINQLFLPQDDIWKPDLVLKNGFRKFEELGGSFYYVSVFSDGTVIWFPYQVFESRCEIDITYFPFDEQICDIKFIAWSHTVVEIDIRTSAKGIEFVHQFKNNGVWTVVSTFSSIKKDSVESEITFTIQLRRKPLFYIMNTILPIIFLGILNLLVFLIPADAGEKMSYSVTVFLAFAVFLSIISNQLPTNSDSTSILSIYLIIQMIYGILALIISSFQLSLRHENQQKKLSPTWIKIINLEKRIRRVKSKKDIGKVHVLTVNACENSQGKHVLNGKKLSENPKVVSKQEDNGKEGDKNVDKEEPCNYDWNDVSASLDFFCFWIFLISDFVVTLTIFVISVKR